MATEVVLLGTGTCVPHPSRVSAGVMLRHEGRVILVDTGSGVTHRMAEAGSTLADLDAILYTHIHPDHTMDLIPALFGIKYTPGYHRSGPLLIYGPSGIRQVYDGLVEVYGQWFTPEGYDLTLEEVDSANIQLGPIQVTTTPVEHSVPTVAYQFSGPGGWSVVVSGDTEYCSAIEELAKEVDLLVLECATPGDSPKPGHLAPGDVKRILDAAGPKRTILTHLYPEWDEVEENEVLAALGDHQVSLGRDLMTIRL